ncbi:MAG: class II glutamine amidotransferase [Actinomycetia bacterium]|nr:class II glutamine amidotransferase [Actinomycetes bacterium]
MFARDGALGAYEQLEPTLWGETDPRLRAHHSGEGESELIFLWLMSRLGSVALREPAEVPLAQLVERVRDAVETLADWAKRAGASEPAALTMVLTDGERLVAARRGTRLSWLERPSPKRAVMFSSKPIGAGGWRPALDGMILAAGADARLV